MKVKTDRNANGEIDYILVWPHQNPHDSTGEIGATRNEIALRFPGERPMAIHCAIGIYSAAELDEVIAGLQETRRILSEFELD